MFLPRLSLLLLCTAASLRAQQVFINEFHYDNTGTDAGEGVEIAGPAGTLLSDYDLIFYNGSSGQIIGSPLRLSGTLPNQSNGAGAAWFAVQGIENGPDGMVLYHWPSATVVQRLSYEGSFTAVGGAANGLTLPDIGVAESASTAVNQSLQLTGTGSQLTAFTWAGPRAASPGSLNAGQTLSATPVRSSAMLVSPGLITEGDTATLTLTLSPPPPTPKTFTLSALQPGLITLPAEITIPVTGTASIQITAATDGTADGFQETGILAQPPDSQWPPAAAAVQIIDANRAYTSPPGSLRVLSMNVKLGVGSPGSAEFNAVREVVERLSPDVVVMQEVHSANVFADWFSLVRQCGFPADAAHTAITGDAYAAQPYLGGDIAGTLDQYLVTVSRHPIRQRIQIGRGSGKTEITRYPLLSVVDVPELPDAQDPVIVNVHLKSDSGDAANFRRALEARRIREALATAGFNGAAQNIIITGDFNATDWQAQPASYQTNVPAVTQPGTGQFPDGTTLPQSFSGGADLTNPGFTLTYATFPHSGFNPSSLTAVPLRQADGNEETFAFASFKFDYFFVSQPILNRGGIRTEVYNSALERFYDGIPKRSTIPASGLSTTASDHYAVVGDFPLITRPALTVTFSLPRVNEGDTGLTATITASPPPAAPVWVSLQAWRDDRIHAQPSGIVLSPGQPSLTIPVEVPWLPGAEPHRTISLNASAPGLTSGTGSVLVRNRDASGLLVISQYTEASSGSTPRAVELLNPLGADIDLALTPLQIRRYSNGDATGVVDAQALSGVIPAGGVLVVGDSVTGDYLVSQGLLPAPATPFASQAAHTVSLNAAGKAAFVLDQLLETGNDALEVMLDGVRSDVFGDIGHDPGTAWTGPGTESTSNGTLTLRPGLATGSGGWRQPGLRFTYQAGAGLDGFGIAPALTDPYLTWVTGHALSGMAASATGDPDGDGSPNFMEYALGTLPRDARSIPQLVSVPGGFRRQLRTGDATLSFTLESSPNLSAWSSATGSDTSGPVLPDGTVEKTFVPSGPAQARLFLRQRASRP